MKTYFDPITGECLFCHGSGECPYCAGNGEILDNECPTCSGYGECPVCEGDGERELPETVDIPARQPDQNSFNRVRRRSERANHGIDTSMIGGWMPRQRISVEVLHPSVENYRSHCTAAIFNCGLPLPYAHKLIDLLPEEISYEQYIVVEGLVYSGHHYGLIHDELVKLFHPWWKRLFMDVFSWFRKEIS